MSEINISIDTDFGKDGLDRLAAETCLKIASIYANDNGLKILGERCEDGIIRYWMEERHEH